MMAAWVACFYGEVSKNKG